MPDSDLDAVAKTISRMVDDWGKALEKIRKQLADLEADFAKDELAKKQQEILTKIAEPATKDLVQQILSVKIPPKADPKQMLKLPDVVTKYIDKNGVKLGDYGSLKPDIDVDIKKMQFKKVGLTWTWTFK